MLNPAVEVARAGDFGCGFSVVVSEVRSLAQHSAAAAKETKKLINYSVEQENFRNKWGASARSTMEESIQSVKRVTDKVNEITAANQEQSDDIEPVN